MKESEASVANKISRAPSDVFPRRASCNRMRIGHIGGYLGKLAVLKVDQNRIGGLYLPDYCNFKALC
jgi:hypothetical protein